jgi:hypothetical protein
MKRILSVALATMFIFASMIIICHAEVLVPSWEKTTNHEVEDYPAWYGKTAVNPTDNTVWTFSPNNVWNGDNELNGGYPSFTKPADDYWAEWDHYGANDTQLTHIYFKTTLNIGDGLLTGIKMVNKYNPTGGLSPNLDINDNIYVFVNANFEDGFPTPDACGGTSNATGKATPYVSIFKDATGVDFTTAPDTGWYIAGGLTLDPSKFKPSDNEIYVLTEDYNTSGGVGHMVFEVQKTPVSIDIKPGSYPNAVNINGNGVIPVAILGSADFDVTQIDVGSLSFGGFAVRIKAKGAYQYSIQDVNDDSYPDLVCQFMDEGVGFIWEVGSGTASVTGKLKNGLPFQGTDTIKVVNE